MNFQIYPLTIIINGQNNGFGCGVDIVKIFRDAVENIGTFGGRTKLTLKLNCIETNCDVSYCKIDMFNIVLSIVLIAIDD